MGVAVGHRVVGWLGEGNLVEVTKGVDTGSIIGDVGEGGDDGCCVLAFGRRHIGRVVDVTPLRAIAWDD